MESVLRRLGLKKVEKETDARRSLQKELFALNACSNRGFPSKPSSFAYDPQLSLLAFGTRNGTVDIYGKPGVYFSGKHKGDVEVTKMCFIPAQARLITLCSDNSLHLWEYNEKESGETSLDEVKSFALENSELKMVSSWCLMTNAEFLVLGTDGGNVHFFDVASFSMSDKVILQDTIIQTAPEDLKVNPGSIEAVLQQPNVLDKFLIAYSRGLIVLWDTTDNKAVYTYNSSQQLESAMFNNDGTEFVTAHSDGSYVTWVTNECSHSKDNPIMPYGPFPCKAITAIEWKCGKLGNWTVFAGGMPRANFSEKHTVTVMHNNANVVLDFTSRVLTFLTLSSNDETSDPHSLLVLTEDEFVAVDLSTAGWPTYRLPYLASVDARSPVTAALYVDDFSESLYNNFVNAGNAQFVCESMHDWPIVGGQVVDSTSKQPNVLLTGHADGSVSFWDVSLAGGLSLLYRLNSATVFGLDSTNAATTNNGPSEEEWPPFRKVGVKRSSIDDHRVAVHKLAFCAANATLLVGGASGQVILFKVDGIEAEHQVEQYIVKVTAESDQADWNGPEPLAVKSSSVAASAGFQPFCVVQIQPATKCIMMALHSSGELIAVATEHGLGVFDLLRLKTVYVNHVAVASVGLKMSRSRSFQRTLRDSFRQLRRNRSESDQKLENKTEPLPAEQQAVEDSGKQELNVEATTEKLETVDIEIKQNEDDVKKVQELEKTTEKIDDQDKPVTKEEKEKLEEKTEIEVIPLTADTAQEDTAKPEIEASSPAATKTALKEPSTLMAVVNSLSFANTTLLQGQNLCVTLWVGTVAGHILIFQLTIPEADKRKDEEVKCVLAKEIQLKHRAPVIATFVIDRNSRPVVEGAKSTETDTVGHRVAVCTEQQVKIFSLPTLKANNKFKLAQHGEADSRFISAQFVNFISKSDEAYSESDLVCLGINGKLHVLSVPQLRLQAQSDAMFKSSEDCGTPLNALTSYGGVCYIGGSQLAELSLSARRVFPQCRIQLEEGMRPLPEPEVKIAVSEEAATEEAKSEDVLNAVPNEQSEEQASSADCSKTINESVVSTSDSMAAGDVTVDSIKVHVKEEETLADVVCEGDTHKVVETMVHSVKVIGGVTEESKTTTIEEISKVEGMMSVCTVTSTTSSSSAVEQVSNEASSSTTTG